MGEPVPERRRGTPGWEGDPTYTQGKPLVKICPRGNMQSFLVVSLQLLRQRTVPSQLANRARWRESHRAPPAWHLHLHLCHQPRKGKSLESQEPSCDCCLSAL